MSFTTANAYGAFRTSVMKHQRYVHDESVREFLAELSRTSLTRRTTIPAGAHFWRAQLGHTYRWQDKGEPSEIEIEAAYSPKRMTPDADLVRDGRVNPRGIAVLYLATNENTACAEVRPWLGSSISLAQFRTRRSLELIDCTRDPYKMWKGFDVNVGMIPWEPEEYEGVVWGEIGHALSKPVQADDASLSYIPTQVIAEAFRAAAADGIVYRSLLGEDGFNVVLFNIGDAELRNCRLMEARKMAWTFEQSDNPYFITDGPAL